MRRQWPSGPLWALESGALARLYLNAAAADDDDDSQQSTYHFEQQISPTRRHSHQLSRCRVAGLRSRSAPQPPERLFIKRWPRLRQRRAHQRMAWPPPAGHRPSECGSITPAGPNKHRLAAVEAGAEGNNYPCVAHSLIDTKQRDEGNKHNGKMGDRKQADE
jgi:hypothetical protein